MSGTVPAKVSLSNLSVGDEELAFQAGSALLSLRESLSAPLEPLAPFGTTEAAPALDRATVQGPSTTMAIIADALYLDQLSELAAMVAARAEVDPTALYEAWSSTEDRRMVAVLAALSQVGTPYKRLGSAPGGFDCSGLVYYAWSQAGVKLTRSSSEQIRNAQRIDQVALRPGDIVWRPGHVLLYLGVGEATVDSPRSGQSVSVKPWGNVQRFGSPIG